MWLVQHGLAAMSPEGVEIARICEVADATLRARRLQNRLAEAEREALNLAVA
jgi:hypothetical protein